MKLRIIIACALSLMLASPVLAQGLTVNNRYHNTTTVTTPEQAPGFGLGSADGGGCPTFSVGGSAPSAGAGISFPLPGRCQGLRNDNMAVDTAMNFAALTGSREAGIRYAVGNSPRLWKAANRAGIVREPVEQAAALSARNSVGVVPAQKRSFNPFGAFRRMEPFQGREVVEVRTAADFSKVVAGYRSTLCSLGSVTGYRVGEPRRPVEFVLASGASCKS